MQLFLEELAKQFAALMDKERGGAYFEILARQTNETGEYQACKTEKDVYSHIVELANLELQKNPINSN